MVRLLMRLRAWLWILALAALAGLGLVRLQGGRAIQTDLLAMLPETERNPVAEQAIRVLAQATGDRALFLVGSGHGEPVRIKAAARAFARSLAGSGGFGQVTGQLPPMDPGLVTRFYGRYRFRLPLAGDEARVDDPAVLGRRVQARLASPMGALPGLGPAEDPLGSLEGFLAGLPLNSLHLGVEDGLLTLHAGEGLYILVSATLKGSAFDPGVQGQSLAAVAGAERALAPWPELEVLRTGAVFYAADARTSAEWETGLISWGSLAAIVVLFLLVFRSARHLLLGLACVAAGLVAATAATLLVFGRIHLLTLVCGASMLGVAVDYPFLYFAHHLGEGPGWDARAALRRLLPALLLGLVTTLLGYATLGVAPFPGLRQMAVFSMAGLVASFLTVVLVLPDPLGRPAEARPGLMAAMDRALARWLRLASRPGFRWCLVLAGVLLLVATVRLRVSDDVKGLIQPSGWLQAQEGRIRELTGLSNSARFFLVEGPGEADVLAREEALRARLEPLLRQGELEGLQAVSQFVPSPGRQAEALAVRQRRMPALVRALVDLGFKPETVAGQIRDLDASAGQPLTVAAWLAQPFALPFRRLWLGPTVHGAGSMVYPMGSCPSAALRAAASGLAGVSLVDKAESVSGLLGHYRRLANGALALAILLVWLMLLRWYGWGRGSLILAPSLAGILGALAGLALLGMPLTLFNTIALVLVLGFGVDYAVFLGEAGDRTAPALLGVLLASFATLLSYGLLAFSHTPALRGFGLTLGLGVLGSTLLAPLVRTLGPRKPRTPGFMDK